MSLVIVEQQDHVVTLTLNDPAQHNPISDPPMVAALVAALEQADADGDVRAVILTGAGKSFSAGGNLKKMLPGSADSLARDNPAETPASYRDGIQRLPLLFSRLHVPVIAAVNGAAVGAGCDLACMCDLRIASSNARFAESFVKLGLIPGDGGAWLLQRVVGYAKAAELAFTGERIDAQAALACGLVSQVVAPEDLLPAARALAARIAVNPRLAVRQTKRLMLQAREAQLAHCLESAAAVQALLHTTEEHVDAVRQFLNRS